jgi:hypothetical protein
MIRSIVLLPLWGKVGKGVNNRKKGKYKEIHHENY